MRAEYKRDVSHNYLILQEEKAVRYLILSGTYAYRKCDSVHTEMSFAESGW